MKKDILSRYDKTQSGELILKISTKRVEDLYDNYDQESTFLKKDLTKSLVDYLIESVDEIGDEPFVIEFYFDQESIEEENNIVDSIKSNFEYLQELERKKMREQIQNSYILMAIGFIFVLLSVLIEGDKGLVYEVLSEGVMVAGWVSLWEAAATFLIKWLPFSKKLKLFKKISSAKVWFGK